MLKITSKNLLIISSILILSSCDEQREQKDNSEVSQEKFVSGIEASKPLSDEGNSVTTAREKVFNNKGQQQAGISNESGILDPLAIEDKTQQESVVLDLSLYLELDDHNYDLQLNKQNLLRGIFASEGITGDNIEMEAHFAGPHNENKEKETTPDGAGVKFKIGF